VELKKRKLGRNTEILKMEVNNIQNIESLNIDNLIKLFTDAITKSAELTIGKNKNKQINRRCHGGTT